MKDKNDKKKFKESKIGKIIYGFLLFMPLLAIGVTCGYAMFNKNAYKSYKDEQEIVLNELSDFKYEETYYYSADSIKQGAVYETNSKIIAKNLFYNSVLYENVEIWFYGESNTNIRLYVRNVDTSTNIINYGVLTEYQFSFEYLSTNFVSNAFNLVKDFFTFKESKTIDNVFYYSVNKVTQSNLFNWVTTSNIYTGMHNFTTAMSVTNTFLPMLLTYWLIISVIYFLYDMILVLLTVLHRKIHNLQDSI